MQGARGSAWRLRASRREATRQEVARGEAGGGRALSGARHASPLFVLLAEEEEDKGEEVGWAALGRWWRQVSGWRSWARWAEVSAR